MHPAVLFGEGVQLDRNKRRPTPRRPVWGRPAMSRPAMLGSFLKFQNLLVEAWPFHLARGQPDSKINSYIPRGQVDLMMGDDLVMIW